MLKQIQLEINQIAQTNQTIITKITKLEIRKEKK